MSKFGFMLLIIVQYLRGIPIFGLVLLTNPFSMILFCFWLLQENSFALQWTRSPSPDGKRGNLGL